MEFPMDPHRTNTGNSLTGAEFLQGLESPEAFAKIRFLAHIPHILGWSLGTSTPDRFPDDTCC